MSGRAVTGTDARCPKFPTVTSSQAVSAAAGGLGVDGRMIVVGAAAEPIEFAPLLLTGGRRSLQGWPAGTSSDAEDTPGSARWPAYAR